MTNKNKPQIEQNIETTGEKNKKKELYRVPVRASDQR